MTVNFTKLIFWISQVTVYESEKINLTVSNLLHEKLIFLTGISISWLSKIMMAVFTGFYAHKQFTEYYSYIM